MRSFCSGFIGVRCNRATPHMAHTLQSLSYNYNGLIYWICNSYNLRRARCPIANADMCVVAFVRWFRSLRLPASTSSRRRLSLDAQHWAENLRPQLECHQKDCAQIRHQIQHDHRYARGNGPKCLEMSNFLVYFVLNAKSLDLSNNSKNFRSQSTDLNLSNNQINKLPDEFANLAHLLRLDISHNLFLSLPKAVFKMPKLRQLKANNNAIIGKSAIRQFSPTTVPRIDKLRPSPLRMRLIRSRHWAICK